MKIKLGDTTISSTGGIGITGLMWLGGAISVAHQPGYGFWDGMVWLYYVGRFIAENATVLH